MKWMDQLPSVTSCCFCCYLRAGCIMIAFLSFGVSVILAPNVSYVDSASVSVLPVALTKTEVTAQVLLGIVSILFCICSILLFIGSFCNIPFLIEIYQWGLLIYGVTATVLYIIFSTSCFLVHTDSRSTGAWFAGFAFMNFYLTSYFLIVANSLRMSILFVQSTDVMY